MDCEVNCLLSMSAKYKPVENAVFRTSCSAETTIYIDIHQNALHIFMHTSLCCRFNFYMDNIDIFAHQ